MVKEASVTEVGILIRTEEVTITKVLEMLLLQGGRREPATSGSTVWSSE